MIIVRNLKVGLNSDFSDCRALLESCCHMRLPKDSAVRLYKKGVDARRKDAVHFNVAFTVASSAENDLLKRLKRFGAEKFEEPCYNWPKAEFNGTRPVVVGFGPAGMFAALCLARAGLRPIVLERGRDADTRKRDVDAFFSGNELNAESNIQFGEGGAGTFSDGKLNTGIKDARIRTVLRTFADHGAGERVLVDAKPHIGTDVLIEVVKSIRKEIISLGGEVLFQHKVEGLNTQNGRLCGLAVSTPDGRCKIKTNYAVLAIGHSARDTFEMLKNLDVKMEPKAFAIGARIEHSRSDIDKAQYGDFADHPALSAADYKLSCHLENGRGVFTFCMCPGGEVVNASSEQGMVAVNGMSYSDRGGENSNSALLVSVSVDDYFKGDVLDGMYFQREIEKRAFKEGNGRPVSQTVGDFLGTESYKESIKPSVKPNVTFGSIENVLPQFVCESLREGIVLLDRKLKGFADSGAVLTAPETRSSSPVRILRDSEGVCNIGGLYPCGEGAGYAGGITSAAVDGLKTAELIIKSLSR